MTILIAKLACVVGVMASIWYACGKRDARPRFSRALGYKPNHITEQTCAFTRSGIETPEKIDWSVNSAGVRVCSVVCPRRSK